MYEGGAEGKCHSINEVISNRWTVEVLVSIYSALCSIPAPLSLNSLLKAVIVIKGLIFLLILFHYIVFYSCFCFLFFTFLQFSFTMSNSVFLQYVVLFLLS